MPPPETILTGLTTLANDWRWVAIAWHVLLAALIGMVFAGWRPSARMVGYFLIAPMLTVSLLAWRSGNLFNGTAFAVLALTLAVIASRLSKAPARIGPPVTAAPGVVLIALGVTYPHFVRADSWATYLYASPFGTLPCPTLAVVIGATLLLRNLRSGGWSTTLVVAGLVYGSTGVLRLGVVLDWSLIFGSGVLAAGSWLDVAGWRSVRATRSERNARLPGDEYIREPFGTMTHAITIVGAPPAVWPWLIQMGAGTRAGWYSYDALDNGRRPSATRILAELQKISIGTLFPAVPGITEGFVVLTFDEPRSLVLMWPNPDGTPLVTWAFVLESRASNSTRVIVRARAGQGYRFFGLPRWCRAMAGPVHFVMERKQLLGIARRVESSTQGMGDPDAASGQRRNVA